MYANAFCSCALHAARGVAGHAALRAGEARRRLTAIGGDPARANGARARPRDATRGGADLWKAPPAGRETIGIPLLPTARTNTQESRRRFEKHSTSLSSSAQLCSGFSNARLRRRRAVPWWPCAQTRVPTVISAPARPAPCTWHGGCKGHAATTISHTTGEDDANQTVADGDHTARAGGLRLGDQRAYRAQSRREPARPPHVPGPADSATEARGRHRVDHRPHARELDLEPRAADRPDAGVRGPRLRGKRQ